MIADVSLLAELNHLGSTFIIKMFVCSVCAHFFAIVRASKYNPVNKTDGLKQVMKVLLYEIWCWIRLNTYPRIFFPLFINEFDRILNKSRIISIIGTSTIGNGMADFARAFDSG